MHARIFHEAPDLPQVCEAAEVTSALRDGVAVSDGNRYVDPAPATYDVQGVLLPRPFKVVRIGPVALFVRDVERSVEFYTRTLGLALTEWTSWQGERCAFLRTNTEHHALALYPLAVRSALALSDHTTLGPISLQVANYQQLNDAISFLRANGCTVTHMPAALRPGIEYAACVRDPDGHTIQLYHSMEQIGWDGRPRPAAQRPVATDHVTWPEVLSPTCDTYRGEPFLGPWG
jgi:catechol 2,3-dioxygenase-like lactoylglutathione lyase family enzyme